MRKVMTATIGVLLAGGAAIAASSTTGQPRSEQGLCRRAPALAVLPPEMAIGQQRDGVVSGTATYAPGPPPPPPPPPPVAERDAGTEEVAVTGTRVARPELSTPSPVVTADVPPPSAPPPTAPMRSSAEGAATPPVDAPPGWRPSPPRRDNPPAGLLTAGDHDDLLNPLLYARYAFRAMRNLGQQVANLPSVDTRQTLTVEVRDSSGRPAPFVPVRVGCADGNFFQLDTLADGKVVLFPALDHLGERVTLSVPGARREVVIGSGAGGQVQTLVTGAAARPVQAMDLMIALDATGSMGDEIAFLRSELQAILAQLRRDQPGLDLRVGLTAYRDIGDEFVTWTLPLGRDLSITQGRLAQVQANGGGDMPEAMDEALIRAVGQEWRPGAVRSLLLVADAPPHDDKQGRAFAAVEAARQRRVQIVPVASSGVDDRAEYFMRAAAALTQSRYVFLTDDSGIGNPHAEPAVDCYVVTSLASAIRRVLASQIEGYRIEPQPAEVIRTSGRYDNGRCVLPPSFSVQ